ncbi:cytochrome P450 [Nocardia sp. bgisy134]|uniref:cytochrome P450 n=1 Tax=Nocardia sp. bgisy134 TaxID=3413789 RepID=UPI003D75C027
MKIFRNNHSATTDKDISSLSFWARPFAERDETFAWLRRNAPVSWHPSVESPFVSPEVHGEAGFWAVVLADDIEFVSQNHELFSNEIGGVGLDPVAPGAPEYKTFLTFDPPKHTHYRKALAAAFTPKAVRRLDEMIRKRAHQIVSNVVGAGEIDLVEEVSSKLPMLTIADMVGVPESLVETFANAGNTLLSLDGETELPNGVSAVEFMHMQLSILQQIGVDLVEFRREHPADDIVSALAQYEWDGRRLNADEIGSVMVLLSVAGNDTTKQTTTATVYALDRNPAQRRWLAADFESRIPTAIEEFIRHASPVMQFARTATQDLELGGQQIAAGDKVCVFYCSGNRDESRFIDPHRFDLAREANRHIGFGGGGIHYCLGNGVAKAQLRALFSEIFTLLPNLSVVGEPKPLGGTFINGIRHLHVHTN